MAPASAAKSPATPADPVPATPPKWPTIEDSPKYQAAAANLARLQTHASELERRLWDYTGKREDVLADRSNAVAAVLAGKSPSDVRRDSVVKEADHQRVLQDLHLTRRAVDAAKREIQQLSYSEKAAVAKPFAEWYRQQLRKMALAFMQYAAARRDVEPLIEHLQANELVGSAGCVVPIPNWGLGDASQSSSNSAAIIRELIDEGIITERDVPAGLAIAPPSPKPSPTPPPPKPPMTPGEVRRSNNRFLRRLIGAGD